MTVQAVIVAIRLVEGDGIDLSLREKHPDMTKTVDFGLDIAEHRVARVATVASGFLRYIVVAIVYGGERFVVINGERTNIRLHHMAAPAEIHTFHHVEILSHYCSSNYDGEKAERQKGEELPRRAFPRASKN